LNASPLLLLLRRRWWLLLVGLVPTLLVTVIGVSGQPPVYESTSTFVVRPIDADAERVMRAMDTLLRGVEINETYANVVGSRLIKERALERLELSEEQREGLDAGGRAITGTSILELDVTARDPEVALSFAEAVAAETVAYIDELENGFGLMPLDAPTLPGSDSGSQTLFMIVMSGLLGTVLGLGLVYASGQLVPLGDGHSFDIVDPETGAYTESFFLQRLREEVARIDHSGGALTTALLAPVVSTRFEHLLRGRGRGAILTQMAEVLRMELREGDVLAHLGAGRFAVLAMDRIDPELAVRLRSAHPKVTFRVSETTYVGREGEEGTIDDLSSVLQRLRDGITGPSHAGADSSEARPSAWSGQS
jgi:GGDEF domain-containing protein/capsular polysaccharide biosynthesis protein